MVQMKSKNFIQKIKDAAKNYKTLYVMGCFGAPLTADHKSRYINNGLSNGYNAQAGRKAMINAASSDTFGFDCVCLIKGILWGWNGDKSKTYGGAVYLANGVPDIGADDMFAKCAGQSASGWADMIPGEALWCSGHIGVYIGDGLAVECTPSWENKVQITAVANIGAKNGYNARKWAKHGKLPYIDYSDQQTATPSADDNSENTASGKYGVGDIVQFTGKVQYGSSDAPSGIKATPCTAEITKYVPGAPHPYHVIHTDKSSDVYGWVNESDIESGSPSTNAAWKPEVGDTVIYNGKIHYGSSDADNGKLCTGGQAKITKIQQGAKHPYHLLHTDDSDSTVFGWVDAGTFAKV